MRKVLLAIYGMSVLTFVSGCGITKVNGNTVVNNTESTEYTNTGNSEKLGVHQNVDYREYKDADELVSSTDLVFSGTVYEKRCELLDVREDKSVSIPDEEKTLYTIYGVYVDKVYKGSVKQDKVYVSVTGGELEKNNYIYSGETADLDIDNKYLFCASDYPDYGEDYLRLVNVRQSVYSMEDGINKKRITAVGNNGGITLSEIFEATSN